MKAPNKLLLKYMSSCKYETMKNVIAILILIIPFTGATQFIVNYDESTNTLSVDYTGCDECLFASRLDVAICNCRLECEQRPDEEALGAYHDCVDQCERVSPLSIKAVLMHVPIYMI